MYNVTQLEKFEQDWANAYSFLFAAVQSGEQSIVDEAELMIEELEKSMEASDC